MTDLEQMAPHLERAAKSLRIEPIKLTREHWNSVKAMYRDPDPKPWAQPLNPIFGTPIIVVDKLTESTPYLEGWITVSRWRRLREWWLSR